MKTVRMIVGYLVDGRHREPGEFVGVPDDVASLLVKAKGAEVVADVVAEDIEANRLAEAISPAIDGGNPRQSQEALGLRSEEHPGLTALDNAQAPGIPKRYAKKTP